MSITYQTEFKKEIVRRYQSGEGLKSLSKELNISQSTLYRWRREFCSIETPQRPYTPKEFDAILRKSKKWEHEKEIIQLSGGLEKIPMKKKLKRWICFCAILGLFSRKIVGWRVSRNASTNLVTAAFRKAYRERGEPKSLTFHSDRGKQYTSKVFCELLQKCGAKQSFSATARPHDNAVAEAFFATFKKEEAYRREYTSEQNFRRSVESYIEFYNETRPHRTLKYQTPQAIEDEYFMKKQCSNSDPA